MGMQRSGILPPIWLATGTLVIPWCICSVEGKHIRARMNESGHAYKGPTMPKCICMQVCVCVCVCVRAQACVLAYVCRLMRLTWPACSCPGTPWSSPWACRRRWSNGSVAVRASARSATRQRSVAAPCGAATPVGPDKSSSGQGQVTLHVYALMRFLCRRDSCVVTLHVCVCMRSRCMGAYQRQAEGWVRRGWR